MSTLHFRSRNTDSDATGIRYGCSSAVLLGLLYVDCSALSPLLCPHAGLLVLVIVIGIAFFPYYTKTSSTLAPSGARMVLPEERPSWRAVGSSGSGGRASEAARRGREIRNTVRTPLRPPPMPKRAAVRPTMAAAQRVLAHESSTVANRRRSRDGRVASFFAMLAMLTHFEAVHGMFGGFGGGGRTTTTTSEVPVSADPVSFSSQSQSSTQYGFIWTISRSATADRGLGDRLARREPDERAPEDLDGITQDPHDLREGAGMNPLDHPDQLEANIPQVDDGSPAARKHLTALREIAREHGQARPARWARRTRRATLPEVGLDRELFSSFAPSARAPARCPAHASRPSARTATSVLFFKAVDPVDGMARAERASFELAANHGPGLQSASAWTPRRWCDPWGSRQSPTRSRTYGTAEPGASTATQKLLLQL